MIKCLKCGKSISCDIERCPTCGTPYNRLKFNFITYIGPEDSLFGYQKSYKLILLKFIFEEIMNSNQATVERTITNIWKFYLDRYNQGQIIEFDADERIMNIQKSTIYDVFAVIKSQPFKVINEKGFLFLNRNAEHELIFSLHENILSVLTCDEIKTLLAIIDKKIELYYHRTSKSSKEYPTVLKNDNPVVVNTINDNIKNGYEIHGLDDANIMEKKEIDLKQFTQDNSNFNILNIDIFDIPYLSVRAKNCLKRNKLNNLAEVIAFSENNELTAIPNLGYNTHSEILQVINNISELSQDFISSIDNRSDKKNGEKLLVINDSNHNLSINCLNAFNVSQKLINSFLKSQYSTIGMLNRKTKNEIAQIVGVNKLEAIFETLSLFSEPINVLAQQALNTLETNGELEIYKNRASGFTLQQIANKNDLTRERVRQLEVKTFRTVRPFTSTIFKKLLQNSNAHYVTLQQILDVFENDDFNRIFVHALKNEDLIEYLDFAEIFVQKKDKSDSIYEELSSIAKDFVGEGIDFFSNLEQLEEILSQSPYSYITSDLFLDLLISMNAKFYGDYVCFSKISYGKLCAKIIFEKFKDGISINNSDDIKLLRKYTLEKYGDLSLPESNRALCARISEFVVLCGRGKYTAPENILVDYGTLETIKSHIDKLDYPNIYYMEIFNEFEGLLQMTSNISNYNFLHGVLMYFYPNDYEYFRDYLTKKIDKNEKSLSDRILEILINNNQAMHRAELNSKLGGYSDIMIFGAISTSENIFQWEHNYYNCIQNISIDDVEYKQINHVLNHLLELNDGYCSDNMLYNEIKLLLPDFVERNGIKNASNLFYVASCMYKNCFSFSRPHICAKDFMDIVTTKNIALKLLSVTDVIKYSEFVALSKKFLWSEVTSSMVFSDIEKDFLRISEDIYVSKSAFSLSDEDISKVKCFIENNLSDIKTLSLLKIDEFEDFPKIKYDFNKFLLASIISYFDIGFKVIQPQIRDRRYQKGIVVYSHNSANCLDELVAQSMLFYSINSLSENQFLSFLCINGFVLKMIPKELYQSSVIKYDNGNFSII